MQSRHRFGSILLSFLAAACSGGGGGGDDTIKLSGTVLFVPDTLTLQASHEPASFDETHETLALAAGRKIRIQGRLDAGRDVVRLRSSERVSIVAALRGDEGARMASVDPVSMEIGTPGREARFLARGPFELLVRGQGEYELFVAALPIGGPVQLAGHLGTFVAGDELSLVAREGGRASLSCAEALDLSIESSGALEVRDAHGLVAASIPASGGTARVEGAMLASFELASHGPHADPVRLRAVEPTSPRSIATIRPLAHERAAFALAADATLATEVTAEFVPGEVLVRAREGRELSGDVARRSGRVAQSIPETSDLVAVDLPAGLDAQELARATLAAVAAFEASDSVEWAELNRIRRHTGMLAGGVTPNDTHFGLQSWHYDLINMRDAWSQSDGDASVIAAVIDTGIQSHPDLDPHDSGTGFDFISSAANAADGDGIDADPTDPGDGTPPTVPSSFHGTHVAGTIGARGNDGFGVTGVNMVVSLMHLRVLGTQGGTDADIAQAIRYAAGLSNNSGTTPPTRADVINMSLGGPGFNQTMQNAVTAARNAGVVILAAAGNNNSSQSFFPASYTNVVSVSAVDRNAAKAPYSNFGPNVDIAAPGGDTSVDLDGDGFADGVLSTLVDEDNGLAPNFVFYQGTSMACPHAAGLAALMLSVEPTLTPLEIETILQTTAIDLGAAGRDNIFGHGLIQADLALTAAAGNSSGTPVIAVSPTTLNFGASTTLLTINVSNAGGGTLDVGTPTFTPTLGDPVFVTDLTTVASTGGSTDVSAVRVTVDRTALADGTYTGVVSIPTANGGTANVDVSMDVTTAPPPVDVDLFLLVVDVDTFDTVAQVDLNPTTTLDWVVQSTAIPAADYFVICGSDDDGDFFIGGANDIYLGAFPTLNEIEILALAAGSTKNNLDFVVGPSQSTLGPAKPGVPAKGFKLLRPPSQGPN